MKEKLLEIVNPILEMENVELYELEVKGVGSNMIIRLFIDKPGGVTVEDCRRVSRHLDLDLDAHDIIPHKYTLEVSSPGIDRPLKTDRDFKRALYKQLTVRFKEKFDGKMKITGALKDFDENTITLEVKEKKETKAVVIERENIEKAKIKIEF